MITIISQLIFNQLIFHEVDEVVVAELSFVDVIR